MTEARIGLIEPLTRGWNAMVQQLFRPFQPVTWLALGFAAWLAGLADGGANWGLNWESEDGPQIPGLARSGWDWMQSNEAMAGFIVAAVLTALVLLLVIVWVSSRAKFIFLDDVVHRRAAIAEPWARFRERGNSLFAFRVIAFLLCLPAILGLIALGFWLALGPEGWTRLEGPAMVAGAVGTGLVAFLVVVVAIYAFYFLDAFVVPLMHRYDLGVMAAWSRFGSLFRAHPWWFLANGLFVFVLCMIAMAAIVTTGFMTCCLGFLLLALPYVGTVVLLPLLVTYRAFTVEFLAQFDPDLLAGSALESVAVEPVPAAGTPDA